MRTSLLSLVLCFAAAAAMAATASAPVNYTNDALTDFEPTITRARTLSGSTATVTVSIKEVNASSLKNYYVVKDGANTFQGYLPTSVDKPISVDPYLYPNQYNSLVAPYRLYCVGILSSATSAFDNAITVWRSDDAGRDGFATLPFTIIETGGSNIPIDKFTYEQRTLDKPTIVVNGHVSFRGYVYVSYMRKSVYRNVSNNLIQKTFYSIYVTRSTNGGASFDTPVQVWTNENDPAPQPVANCAHVVTANNNGYVYVTWAIFTPTNKIMLGRSPSAGTIAGAWVIDSNGPTGNFKTSNPSGMQTMTVPITRYNWIVNKLMVVWNERESSDPFALSDVYYAEKGTAGWSTWGGVKKLKISNENAACGVGATTDQVRPAFDFDANAKMTVAYYDRQNDCLNVRYDVYFTQLTTTSMTPATVVQAPTKASPFTSAVTDNSNRIGEYFDVWCEGTTCYTAWIGTPNNDGDVLVTTIQ